jgi:ribosome recycling factor
MLIRLRRAPSVLSSSLTLLLLALVAIPSRAAEKTHLRVDDYQIEVELTPHLHQISARAKVKFTALQDISVAVFELHNNLRVTRVLDDQNQPLSAERVTQDSTIRVPLPAGTCPGRLDHAHFRIRRSARNRRRQPGSRP